MTCHFRGSQREKKGTWGVWKGAWRNISHLARDRYLNDRVWGGVHWAWNKTPLLGQLFFREKLISSFSRSFSVSIFLLSPAFSSRLHSPSSSLSFPSSWHSCDRNPPREVLPKESAPPLTPPPTVLPRSFSRTRCTEVFPAIPNTFTVLTHVLGETVHLLHRNTINNKKQPYLKIIVQK